AITSRTEGTPIVLLEAISAEIPVVASRVGGIPDVLAAKDACLFGSGEVDELIACIIRLSKSPELRRQLAQSATRAAAPILDFRGWISSYEAMYSKVAFTSLPSR